MPGGLLQLVAYGSQDAILTLDPEYTFFKSIYHRYTNFSKSSETILLEDVSNFNEMTKITIPKKADLLDNITLILDTPELGIKYIRELFEEIKFQKSDSSYINNLEHLNVTSMLIKSINFLNNKNLFKNVIENESNINVLNLLDIINKNNSDVNKTIFKLLDSSSIKNFDLNSNVFVNQYLNDTKSKLIKHLSSSENSNNYYQDIALNFYYNNNFYQIINYLSTQIADYDINTPNKFIENLFYLYLNYYSGIKPFSFANLSISSTQDISGVSPEEYYKSKNIFAYNLIYSKKNISNSEGIDFDRTIYGTNYIRFSFSRDRINNIYEIFQFDYLFILNSPTFSLKNIVSILKQNTITSINTINEGEQILFYKILPNEIQSTSVSTGELVSTFLEEDLYLQNFLNIVPDINISNQNLWPLTKNVYKIESRQEVRSYKNIYVFKLNNYTNIELGQLLFAFVDNSANESFFRFTLKVLKINSDSIETELFENNLHSNNIQVITGNYSDYNTYPLTYLHLGISQVVPISYRNIDTDIYENFLYVKNSTFNSVKALNNTSYYNNLVTFSGQVLETQHRFLLNFINTLFSGIFHVSTTFTVDQATLQVSDYNETKFFEDTYKIFVKNYLIKNQNENYSSSSIDYSFIKFARRIIDYLSTPSSVSGVPSFKSNITDNFNLCISKGLINSNDVINLLDDIRFLEVRKPFLTIKTQDTNGESIGTYTDGQAISIDDILYVYPSDTILNTIGTDLTNSNLITILQVKEVEYINTKFVRAIVELFDHDISIPNFTLTMADIDKSFNNAWLAKDNSNLSLVKLRGDIKDESRFDISLSNFSNTVKVQNVINHQTFHVDFSENPTGVVNLQSMIEEGFIYNFYQSTTSNYNENNRELIGTISLDHIVLNEDGTRTFTFFLDSINDLRNVLFNTANYYYFAFKVDGAGTDNPAENLTRGLVISSVLTDSRYFTTNILETHQSESVNYRGYKYSNLLYVINCMYLYDQLKSRNKTAFSILALKRLFLIASKIYQVTLKNSNYNVQLESSVILNKRTLKLTYLADTKQIFTTSTIITELLTSNESYTNDDANILDPSYVTTNSIDLILQDGFRNYLLNKVISLNNPFLVNFSDEQYSSLPIHAKSTKTTQITNELYTELYGSKFESGDLTFQNDEFDESLFILTNVNAGYSLVITSNDILSFTKKYFMFLFDQLPSNLNVSNLTELKNITTRKLYFPAANDIAGHEYTRMLDYYYYDDFLSKETFNIGLYFFKYLEGSPLTTLDIRRQVNKKILEPLSYHGLGATKITYLQDLQNFYKVNFLDTTFATYLTKRSTINLIKNIDMEDDLNLTAEDIKTKVYSELNLQPTDDSVADELINLTFSNYEVGKSLNNFVTQRINNNEIYNYIRKITFYSALYQINSIFMTYLNSYLFNNLIKIGNITPDELNNVLLNDNLDLSSSVPSNENVQYIRLQLNNTDIYIPNNKLEKFREKLNYISGLSDENFQNEKNLKVEEGKIINKIKNFTLISESTYPSIEYLELYLNTNYYQGKTMKFTRGALVTNSEYEGLNKPPISLKLNEINSYGGIKSVSIPLNILSIFSVNFNVISFGGKYYINGREQPKLILKRGTTYRFNLGNNSNTGHVFLFSTQSDGSHNNGIQYQNGVVSSGISGIKGSYVQITIDQNTPTLYYYCKNHSGMGGVIEMNNNGNVNEFVYTNNLLNYQNGMQEINFGKNMSGENNIGTENIGIAINGVRLKSYVSDRIPYDNILNTTYSFSVSNLFYFDYQINELTNKLISVGDVIYFYSNSLILDDWLNSMSEAEKDNSYIEKATITNINGNTVTFLSRPLLDFAGSYGYLERFSNVYYENLPSYNFGLRPLNLQIENDSINLVNNFNKFEVKNVNNHLATDQYGETGYYSGKFINDVSNLDNSYIKDSNFNGDNLRHPNGHSKILGISYDGYPIYGPYGYNEKSYDSNQILVNEGTNKKKFYDINEEILRIESSNTFEIFLRTVNEGQFIINLGNIIDIKYKFAVNDVIYVHSLKDVNSNWEKKFQGYWKINNIIANTLYLNGSTNDISLMSDKVIKSNHPSETSTVLSIEIIKFKNTASEISTNVTKLMSSSYKFKNRFGNNRISIIEKSQNVISKYDIGSINDDYEYKENYGDLDEYNGRFCNTPEFPNGTYAYFTTFDDSMVPTYPYIIGPKFKNVKSNYLKINNLSYNYNISTNINFISISSANNPINLSVTTSGQFKINFRTPTNPPPAEDDTDLLKKFKNYLGASSCIKIICPSKPIYNGYWKVIRSSSISSGNLVVKNVDSSVFTVDANNNFTYTAPNDCIIINYSSFEQVKLKNNLPDIEQNFSITNLTNIEMYKNMELIKIVSDNGKFSQCQIVDNGYLIKKLDIKKTGFDYNLTSKISAFTEIPSSLEYIDEYGLLLRRKANFEEGYIYDYDNKKLDLVDIANNLSSPNYDSSINKINNFTKNFYSLNLTQNIFTTGNTVYTSVNTTQNILINSLSGISSSANGDINIYSGGVDGEIIIKFKIQNEVNINVGDVIYLDFDSVKSTNQQSSRLSTLAYNGDDGDDGEDLGEFIDTDGDGVPDNSDPDPNDPNIPSYGDGGTNGGTNGGTDGGTNGGTNGETNEETSGETNEFTRDFFINNLRHFFKVISREGYNTYKINGPNTINSQLPLLTFDSSDKMDVYIYKNYDEIYEVNTNINSSKYCTLQNELLLTINNLNLETIDNGKFTLSSSIITGISQGDIVKIQNSSINKYNGYFLVQSIENNVLTFHGSVSLFKSGTSDNLTSSSVVVSKYNINSEIGNEKVLNILNLDDIVSQMGTIDPTYFDDLQNKLFSNFSNDYNILTMVINDTIKNIINSSIKDSKIYFNKDIFINKDYNLEKLFNETNLLNFIDNSQFENINSYLYNTLSSFVSNFRKENVTYKNLVDSYNKVLNRNPNPEFAWVKKLGTFMFDEIDLYFNDLLIDRQYSSWVNAWNELNVVNNQDLFNKMIGDINELTDINSNIKKSKKLYIPLRFWFCRYSGINLPLIAMINTDIILKIKMSDINKLIRKPRLTEAVLYTKPKLKLTANYIYLDDTERKLFAEARHEYIIEQVLSNGNVNLEKAKQRINLKFGKNCVKELIWVFEYNKDLSITDISDYSVNGINPINRTKITINTKSIVDQNGIYFNYVVPYEKYKSSPSEGINVFKFGLECMGYQPSGTLNFSILDDAEMLVTLNSSSLNLENKHIRIFASSYNILRIMSGHSGIAFIE